MRPTQLHIPDGFLSPGISLLFWVVSILIIALAVRNTRGVLGDRQAPLMGIMAAFIFAAQMINFPVAGGTSGHLLGGVLAGITLGPWAGMLVMTSVIAVQALLFQDGGLLVMGANIFNMGLVTVVIGYGLYRAVASKSLFVRMIAIAIAAWLSVIAGALATSLQLWLSNTTPLVIVMPAMLGVHTVIGIGEALITVAAYTFIVQTRPDIIEQQETTQKQSTGWILGGALSAIFVIFLSPFASADPDGLERVAENLGFINTGLDAPYQIIPDYTVPFLGETPYSTILAGLIGAIIVALVAVLLVRLFLSSRSTT